MTGLYLSRLTVLCTVHVLCVAITSVSCRTGVWFSFTHRPHQFTFLVSRPQRTKFLFEFSVPGSFRRSASGIILLKVWQFAAFVDVVLVSSNWIDLELKNSHSASSCSPGSRGQRLSFNLLPTHCGYFRLFLFPRVRGQRLSLNCFPRTVGSAPHQGACADLNRGCTWACRRLRHACSCSARVSSASCGIHCASTSNVLRRASTGTNVLGASACSLCRTY